MRSLNEYITVDESRQGILRPTSKDEPKRLQRSKQRIYMALRNRKQCVAVISEEAEERQGLFISRGKLGRREKFLRRR